ncbi:hypothetical protein [Bifidobacterium psychraerophilum]|jgi:hypothetical protein|uniref:hypothetical protein n=1 Tax=Bifidobacterium psychraerophilum TaxID=218140 RepID=UPI0023F44A5B|nr:hypothetical protein [Bifidobacterium psychraerophilum]MCI1660087.1 hypothetical protein [Bifidobacterium psychraerophilum]MCI1803803.1 hypothetical protein [Bifidobacterium psychraerophilum]MCI2176189.1 hypothetical protein [Bifidobacterium psychraerophilum]MCI2181338.1 hypothetical protein [Bifidobacterium psychraerophilum]
MVDGRTLSSLSFGPTGETPILFIAGAVMGDSSVHDARALSPASNDYRIVVEQTLDGWGESIAVITNSQGDIFGFSSASNG